jgi:hypothetical protein
MRFAVVLAGQKRDPAPETAGKLANVGLGVILGAAVFAGNEPPSRPYSYRMFEEAQKKCAANSFGPCYVQHEVDRLRKECLRDGGRP